MLRAICPALEASEWESCERAAAAGASVATLPETGNLEPGANQPTSERTANEEEEGKTQRANDEIWLGSRQTLQFYIIVRNKIEM